MASVRGTAESLARFPALWSREVLAARGMLRLPRDAGGWHAASHVCLAQEAERNSRCHEVCDQVEGTDVPSPPAYGISWSVSAPRSAVVPGNHAHLQIHLRRPAPRPLSRGTA